MKPSVFRGRRGLGAVWVVLAGGWGVGLASAQNVLHGAGDVYQMRDDPPTNLIPLPPRWYRDGATYQLDEGCFLQGSVLRVVYRITNNTQMQLGCVITVSLAETFTGGPMPECIWQETYGTPTNPRPYPAYNYVDPPAWPGYIVPLRFAFNFAFFLRKGGQWQWVGQKDGAIENFTIPGPPQAPMSPPWIKVLRISCSWMRRTSTELSAQRQLTKRMFGVKYDPITGEPYVDDDYAVWRYAPQVGREYTQ